ncbi:MAG: divergent polysaccharide deacetylase family protein [Nannocystaceae bacterium]|nr:divergent polysaccharide deacetylase family protein [bacterium]
MVADDKPGWGLPLWVAAAVVLFWIAPRPPQSPRQLPEDIAAMQRTTDFVVRDTRQWQRDHGDRSLPWSEADGHLAIVIDDVGRELHLLEKLLSLRYRLTFSVLPGAVYADGVQLRLAADRRRYREVMLHLPMEPSDPAAMAEGLESQETFLLTTDDAETIERKTRAALDEVPAAIAVNNHMGSKLTADRTAMDAVMSVLAQREVFFLDSRTHHDTQAVVAARAAGVPALSRQVFLDHEVSAEAIAAQLDEAARLSRLGPTVAIGHPSAQMYEVLATKLPELLAQGVSVYPLSHVLEHQLRGEAAPESASVQAH